MIRNKGILLFYCLLIFNITNAHDQEVHQYIVREAYKLLRAQLNFDIPIMCDRIGYDETGNGPFNPGGLIVIGAFREDEEDIVWNVGTIPGIYVHVSVTHFWDADNGDNSQFCTNYCVLPDNMCYPNAYQKALKFIYGGYELKVYYPNIGIIEAYEAPSYLPDYYKTGRIFYKGYYNIAGQFTPQNYWTTSPQRLRDKVVWEILGRVAHLLADVSVPAHVHNDQHDPICGGKDIFESWIKNNYYKWNYLDALSSGGIINVVNLSNPIKYLFYTTAQIADHFPSNTIPGDNYSGINEPFSNYPPLQDIINNLPPTSPDDVSNIANVTFVYAIRATAGLLYWFAKEAGLLPIVVPYDYTDIQSAINAAQNTTHKTVVVLPGTHYISNNITVPSGVTLQINPGVVLVFTGNYSLNVYGTLKSNGATFTGSGYWSGIKLIGSQNSEIINCRIEKFSSNGIYIESCNPLIDGNDLGFDIFSVGIKVYNSGPVIRNNYIHNCGVGIGIEGYSNPDVYGNNIANNSFYGIGIWYCNGFPSIHDNIIENNGGLFSGSDGTYVYPLGWGIYLYRSNANIYRNRIKNSGFGISCESYSYANFGNYGEIFYANNLISDCYFGLSSHNNSIIYAGEEYWEYICEETWDGFDCWETFSGYTQANNSIRGSRYFTLEADLNSAIFAQNNWLGSNPPDFGKIKSTNNSFLLYSPTSWI